MSTRGLEVTRTRTAAPPSRRIARATIVRCRPAGRSPASCLPLLLAAADDASRSVAYSDEQQGD